jgi:hypothetical protein
MAIAMANTTMHVEPFAELIQLCQINCSSPVKVGKYMRIFFIGSTLFYVTNVSSHFRLLHRCRLANDSAAAQQTPRVIDAGQGGTIR